MTVSEENVPAAGTELPIAGGDASSAFIKAVVASFVELSEAACVVAVVPLGSAGVPERFEAVPLVLLLSAAEEASTICPDELVPTTVFDVGTAAPLTPTTV